MNSKLRTIFAALTIAAASVAVASAPPDSGKIMPLTVEQSVQLGLDNSKALHGSLMNVQLAGARESEVRTNGLPSLSLNGAYTRLSSVPPFAVVLPPQFGFPPFVISPTIDNAYTTRLTLTQPIFTGFRLQASTDAAEYNTRAAEHSYTGDKNNLIYNVKNAYWNLFKAIEIKKVIDENIDEVQAHLNDVQNLMNHGMATNNDVLRVQVQLSNTQLLQIDAKNNVELAMVGLDNVMGVSLDTRVSLVSLPQAMGDSSGAAAIKTLASLDSLVHSAIESRPEMKAMDFRLKASDAQVTASRSGWYPQVYLVGDYNYNRPNSRYVPTTDEFKDSWDIGVSASWNIWNWGQTADQSNEAEAQRSQTEDASKQLHDAITLEVTQDYLNVHKAAERVGVSQTTVQQAQENYRVTNEKYKSGLALNSDVLDAQVSLLQAKTNYTQALVDLELATALLAKAVGE